MTNQNQNPPEVKNRLVNVTVSVDLIRLAVVMRQRQRKYRSSGENAYLASAIKAEKEFDEMLTAVVKELLAVQSQMLESVQSALL